MRSPGTKPPPTWRMAVLVFPVSPLEPTVTGFSFFPFAVALTFSEMKQPSCGRKEVPDMLTFGAPAFAVTVPLQSKLSPLGVATTRPGGRSSLKLTPVSPVAGFGLMTANESEVEPFTASEDAPKDSEIVGGLTANAAEDQIPQQASA